MSEMAEPRRAMTARVFRLGEEPPDDLGGFTTVEERIAMMWPLTLEAWALAGRPIPSYDRSATPVRVIHRPVP